MGASTAVCGRRSTHAMIMGVDWTAAIAEITGWVPSRPYVAGPAPIR